MLGKQEAEDIAREVFAKVSRRLDRFGVQPKLSTWIYCIATNAAIDKLRSPAPKHASGRTPLEGSPKLKPTPHRIKNPD